MPLRVLICGGGNGAHTLATLASSRAEFDVQVLTIFENEADDWSDALQEGEMTAIITNGYDATEEIRSKPRLVSNDPAKVVRNNDVIFIVAPAYAHASILCAIAPYIQPNTMIAGLPAHPGFEMQYFHILQKTAGHCVVVSFETLPWACRLTKYGKMVEVLGVKETVGAFLWEGKDSRCSFDPLKTLQNILGDRPRMKRVQNYLTLNLMAKTIIHPPIMFGKWSNWDEKPLKEKPLFYQGVDDYQANILSQVSDEIINVTKKVKQITNEIDTSTVTHLSDWMKEYYANQVEDDSSLKSSMQTNKAYKGLTHPMKLMKGGLYVPDFAYRYTREDIPFGLVVLKGIAQIFEVATPTIDEIIRWGQKVLAKEYLVGSELKGKDIGDTRAPQSFGIHSKEILLSLDRIIKLIDH